MVPAGSNLSSLSAGASARYHLRQGPYEIIPHVRICAGGVPGNRHPCSDESARKQCETAVSFCQFKKGVFGCFSIKSNN